MNENKKLIGELKIYNDLSYELKSSLTEDKGTMVISIKPEYTKSFKNIISEFMEHEFLSKFKTERNIIDLEKEIKTINFNLEILSNFLLPERKEINCERCKSIWSYYPGKLETNIKCICGSQFNTIFTLDKMIQLETIKEKVKS